MELERLGRETAAARKPAERSGGRTLARQMRRALKEIEAARRRLAEERGQEARPAAEWLLDNAYLAQREGKDACRALSRCPRRLRRDGAELFIGVLARTLAETGTVGTAELDAFLGGVQRGAPLSELELAHFIPALKGALILRLARLCRSLPGRDEALAGELERLFTTLRTLGGADLAPVLERHSQAEQALRQDPAGAYAAMDDATRARYRDRLCALARKTGRSEAETARRLLELCRAGAGLERHVGYWLFRRPLGEERPAAQGGWYVAAVVLCSLCLSLLLGFLLHSGWVALLLLLPVSDLVKNVLDFLAVRLVRPRPVFRMALEQGVPREGRTLCVIAGLLSGENSGPEYAALLERYRLANRDGGAQLRFGLLADLPDQDAPMGSRAGQWVDAARRAIDALNETYGGGFYLFFREPVFQKTDERYQGWERKRGALLELCRLLKGRRTGLQVLSGERGALNGTRFVLTLDSDTALNVGSARELTGAMLHPLNRAVVDRRRRVVVSGYGVLQPRVGVELSLIHI